MGGSDCEAITAGWLAQPANGWSSLAYVVAAAMVVAGARDAASPSRLRWGAVALVAVGAGSVAFHGPQPSWGDALHDLSIVALLGVLLALPPSSTVAVLGGTSALLLVLPGTAPVLHAGLLTGAGVRAWQHRHPLNPRRRRDVGIAVTALAAGGALFALGRTDGPLCRPESLLQAHAAWHVLSAVAAGAGLRALVPSVRRPVAQPLRWPDPRV